MTDFDLHRPLIGQQGSRAALNTPALVIDRDALDRNIAAMAAFAKQNGLALRPHAKTHKSIDIARLQMAAGALGVCCAKLGEAEALAGQGINAMLITSPVVTPQAIARLVALHERIGDLMVVADNPANVAALATATKDASRPLPILVDIDPGIRRTGVSSPEAAVALAQAIAAASSLRFAGVQYYCGAQQHIEKYEERRAAIVDLTTYLTSVIDQLNAADLAPKIISGGGTGTHRIDASLGVFTELQVGSYVFMDRQYGDCDLGGEAAQPFERALFVDAHVISANSQGMATIDAGFKALSTDGGSPNVISGAPENAMFVFMGDEHGALIAMDHAFKIGDAVSLSPPHCDPTVNLYDAYHIVREGTLIDIWPVTARGRSR
ncbi:DSD1 family PLP-dependent enzyme [Terricaulis silvestris]|uniref:3-hydroxy-D-aspartate aldolase n=1 Tax=Terricaulis silvestris TaxID=2686094 RepID=A0A6I6MPU5_9CAUL|nr:DSD1 family PLP-dependent enzyme [Terricaulis silvestris]QGZ94807.1 3-hydroxy-D-aspartate aldolase [Terricaulis silvestris]